LRLFDVASGEELRSFGGQPGGVTALAISADGRTLISGGREKSARLWEAGTGQERKQLKGHGGWVEALAVSPDGKVLATGAADGVAQEEPEADHRRGRRQADRQARRRRFRDAGEGEGRPGSPGQVRRAGAAPGAGRPAVRGEAAARERAAQGTPGEAVRAGG